MPHSIRYAPSRFPAWAPALRGIRQDGMRAHHGLSAENPQAPYPEVVELIDTDEAMVAAWTSQL